MPSTLTKLRTALREEGVVSVARRVAQRGAHTLSAREAHIWFSLDLAGDRPRRVLPDGFELRGAAEADAEAIAELPNQPGIDEVRARIAGAAEVYIVREDDRAAFACTIFRGRTPAVAARGGWIELPEGTVCLEDSGTSPHFRGRGVAPGAWCAVADLLAGRGYRTMVTKVEVENDASRRSVMKAGFAEAADMRLRRVGPFRKVVLTPLGAPGAEFLNGALGS